MSNFVGVIITVNYCITATVSYKHVSQIVGEDLGMQGFCHWSHEKPSLTIFTVAGELSIYYEYFWVFKDSPINLVKYIWSIWNSPKPIFLIFRESNLNKTVFRRHLNGIFYY